MINCTWVLAMNDEQQQQQLQRLLIIRPITVATIETE